MGDARSSEQRYQPGGGIVLAPHSATWAATFGREAAVVSDALSGLSIELLHQLALGAAGGNDGRA